MVADHNNVDINPGTAQTITAGSQLGEVTVLVAGSECQGAADKVRVDFVFGYLSFLLSLA